jgi:hypothetical protein
MRRVRMTDSMAKIYEMADMADMLGNGHITWLGQSWSAAELREIADAIPRGPAHDRLG